MELEKACFVVCFVILLFIYKRLETTCIYIHFGFATYIAMLMLTKLHILPLDSVVVAYILMCVTKIR